MPKPRPLDPSRAANSLVQRLAPRVDRVRQHAVRFGLRPMRCWMVWTRFTGDERGVGTEQEIARHEILPTPRVSSLNSVTFRAHNAGMLPEGSVVVDMVSATLTYDELVGNMIPLRHEDAIPQPYDFYYEMQEDGRAGSTPRFKYRIYGQPSREPGKVMWSLVLERISEDAGRDGRTHYGQEP